MRNPRKHEHGTMSNSIRTGTAALKWQHALPLVVETHRRFSTALGASIRYGLPTSDDTLTGPLNDQIREIGTALRDSLLASGRSLIEFYTVRRSSDCYDTDVLLDDFPGSKIPKAASSLKPLGRAIEAHLLHITAWADLGYRTSRPAGDRAWRDWDAETEKFGQHIFDALQEVARQTGQWAPIFARLHTACVKRRDDPAGHWPAELSSPPKISQLVAALLP